MHAIVEAGRDRRHTLKSEKAQKLKGKKPGVVLLMALRETTVIQTEFQNSSSLWSDDSIMVPFAGESEGDE